MRWKWSARGLLGGGTLLLQAAESGAEPQATTEARELVYATSRTTWIYPGPRISTQPLGYLRAGHALPAREPAPRPGPGCRGGWIAVSPRGFICLDRASLGAAPRYWHALQETLGNDGPLDFEFGWSSGAPAFRRVPSAWEAARKEGPFGAGAAALAARRLHREQLAMLDPAEGRPSQSPPWFLSGHGSAREPAERELVRELVPPGSLVASTRRFVAAGRAWLLRTDGTLIAAELVRPFRRSSFQGVQLERDLRLPLFWTRGGETAKYVLGAGGLRASGGQWRERTAVGLDPQRRGVTAAGERYLRTREVASDGSPLYVRGRDATIVEPLRSLPIEPGESGKWLRFSVSRGTLVAYEGQRAVFTTLASPGVGRLSAASADPLAQSATPLGTFRISVKHLADDMGPGQNSAAAPSIAEVPYAQYFDMPFAIHVAYWHENFGQPMSGGCINVSPLDGKYLFDWTLPALPPGWDAVVAGGEHGVGTLVHVVP